MFFNEVIIYWAPRFALIIILTKRQGRLYVDDIFLSNYLTNQNVGDLTIFRRQFSKIVDKENIMSTFNLR